VDKGISTTLSTVILMSVILTITISIAIFASGVIETQNQITEFEEAKTNMIALAETIEDVAAKMGASGYVRINARAGGPYFEKTNENLSIKINGDEKVRYTINLIKFRGGSMVSVGGYNILRGKLSGEPIDAHRVTLLAPGNESIPIGWVYVNQSNGAWIVVDFGRVRVIKIGKFIFSKNNGTGSEILGIVEIQYINIIFGQLGGTGVFNIRARNINITRHTYRIDGVSSISIEASRNGHSSSYPCSFESVDGIIVYIVVVNVKISTYG